MRGAVSLAVLVLSAAAVAQAPAPPIPDEPPVPEDAANFALAKEVADRLNALSYSLHPSGVPGFVARYAVNRAGALVGRETVSWSRAGDTMQAAFAGELPDVQRSRLEATMQRVIYDALCARWDAQGDRAVRRDGKIVMDATVSYARLTPGVRRHIDRIEEDLLSFVHRTWHGDGSHEEETLRSEAQEGVHYLASVLRRTWSPDGDAAESAAELRYARPEGHPFVKRLILTERGVPEPAAFECVLEAVEFRVPRTGEGLPEPERVGREALEAAHRGHYSLYAGDAKGFEALYNVEFQGYTAGRFTARWDLYGDGYTSDYVGPVPEPIKQNFDFGGGRGLDDWVRETAREWLWDAVIFRFEPGEDHVLKGLRRTEDTVLFYEARGAAADPKEIIVLLGPDQRVRSFERRWRDGSSDMRVYDQEAAEGTWFRKRVRKVVQEATGGRFARTVGYQYRRVDGVLLPSLISVKEDSGTPALQNTELTLTLVEAKIRK